MRNYSLLAALALSGLPLLADFSYTQTSQMTGGMILNVMKGLGPLARGSRDPILTTHLLKGNRMATITKDNTSIIDLDKETITTIDAGKKTYSVVTFAEMKQAMENMMAKSQGKKKADVNFKVSAKATGQTKTINGVTANEVIMTMTAEGTDEKSGQKGGMDITMDNWLAPVAGYEQVRDFQKKMGEKMGYLFGSGMAQMGQMQPETLKGFAQVAEEMAKVDGVPVEQVMKMGGNGTEAGGAPAAQTRPNTPSASEAVAGALAGRLGGLGGFGRRKNNDKKEEKKEEKVAEEAPAASGGSGSLIEMTTTLTSFASGSVDASRFDVPSGYKQVENDMVKRSR